VAQLIEEIVVGNTAIKVKFLRTVRVSSITNDRFALAKSAATPIPVSSPFRPIEVSVDYNATSRTLILYFSAHLVPLTSYRFTISGLKDANNAVIPDESPEFTTGTSTAPSVNDPVDPDIAPQPIPIEDYTVDGASDGESTNGNGSGSSTPGSVFVLPGDDFRITGSDPTRDEPIVTTAYKDGRITVKFSEYPSPMGLSTYVKAQKRKVQREYVRWQDVPVLLSLDMAKPWLYVDFPSTDSTPVYRTVGKEYFPIDWKFRVRVNRDLEAAGAGAIGDGNVVELEIAQGATFSRAISYLQANGSPRDLTDYTARMQIRTAVGGDLIVELNTENGGIIIEGLLGRVTMTMGSAETAALPATTGVFDLELSSPDATPVVTRLLEGTVTITPEVTA